MYNYLIQSQGKGRTSLNNIPEYISKWLTIIDQMQNDNTYKLAWGRAILECAVLDHSREWNGKRIIFFSAISECMLKYYWNQQFFFNLKQAPYKDKEPVICQLTQSLIDFYVKKENSNIPVWFDRCQFLLKDTDEYLKTISGIEKILPENVAWRFMNVKGTKMDIYYLDTANGFILFNEEDYVTLKSYANVLSRLLNYKWSQLLEKYNVSPRILSKINGISESSIKRGSLTKYRNELMKLNDGVPLDFYSNAALKNNDISVDHVIPWSYMYSDDIWNFVLTSRSINSIKSNSIPTEQDIEKLNQQNIFLYDVVSLSFKPELKLAIDNHYVDRFYANFRMV